jgi:formylmethanofuran dehydrogenase subunit E
MEPLLVLWAVLCTGSATPVTEEDIEIADRAKEAEKLLNNPLLIEALAALQGFYVAGLKTTCPSKVDELQHWARCHKCGELFEEHLRAVLQKGEVNEKVMRHKKEKKNIFF